MDAALPLGRLALLERTSGGRRARHRLAVRNAEVVNLVRRGESIYSTALRSRRPGAGEKVEAGDDAATELSDLRERVEFTPAAFDPRSLATIDGRAIGLEPPMLSLLIRGDLVDELCKGLVAVERRIADDSRPITAEMTTPRAPSAAGMRAAPSRTSGRRQSPPRRQAT
jgi:hypothetical protein